MSSDTDLGGSELEHTIMQDTAPTKAKSHSRQNSQKGNAAQRGRAKSTQNTKLQRSPRRRSKVPYTAPRSKLERAKAKGRFLATMAARDNITEACRAANIDNKTYQYWLAYGYITVEELQEARQRFDDKCYGIVMDMTIDGVEEPLANNGHLVLDDQGQPIILRRRDTRMTIKFIEHVLERFKPQAQEVNVNIHADVPDQYLVYFDARLLTPLECNRLKRLAERVDKCTLGEPGTHFDPITKHWRYSKSF